jgi:hypothetical protein
VIACKVVVGFCIFWKVGIGFLPATIALAFCENCFWAAKDDVQVSKSPNFVHRKYEGKLLIN